MFRLRIAAAFGVFALVAALASSLAIYRAASSVQREFEAAVVSPLAAKAVDPDVKRAVGLYRAFRERNAIRATREAAVAFALILAFGAAIALASFLALSRPLSRLRKRIAGADWSAGSAYRPLPEEGSAEVRELARAWNGAVARLADYRALVGDSSRFRGWKEIARVTVHEVNNLLTPVMGYSEILSERLEGKDGELAREIMNKTHELRGILERLRSLSHLPEARMAHADLAAAAKAVAGEFPEERVVSMVPDYFPKAAFDPVLIAETLRNLAKNALECGKDVRAVISAETRDGHAVISVSDNGPGIPLAFLEKIFEAGYSSKEGNLGIGLAVVRHVAREHGSEISVHSEPGKGTRFSFQLPLAGAAR